MTSNVVVWIGLSMVDGRPHALRLLQILAVGIDLSVGTESFFFHSLHCDRALTVIRLISNIMTLVWLYSNSKAFTC